MMTIHTLRSISRGSRKSRKANGSNTQYSGYQLLHYGKNVDGCQRPLWSKYGSQRNTFGGVQSVIMLNRMTRDSGRIEGSSWLANRHMIRLLNVERAVPLQCQQQPPPKKCF